MRSFDELEADWLASGPLPRERGRVRLLVVRREPGVHEEPASVLLSPEGGMAGDRWSAGPNPHRGRQITVMMARVIEQLTAGALPMHLPGDNLVVDLDLAEEALPVGSRLRIGPALLEVSPLPHRGCAKFEARFGADALRWVNSPDGLARHLRGINCTVVEAGVVAVGDEVVVQPPASGASR